jgi:hypothetical protein
MLNIQVVSPVYPVPLVHLLTRASPHSCISSLVHLLTQEFVDILGKAQLQQSSKAEYYWRISREEAEL